MVKAYPAPKPRLPQYVWIAYAYAGILCVLAVAALMGLGGFDFAFVAYTTPGLPVMTVILAGLAIFSLPFLTRLNLSVLARFFSALFAVTTPGILLVYLLYLMGESAIPFDWLVLAGGWLLVALGIWSHVILDGRQALSFPKK